jgi:hypothetical protein
VINGRRILIVAGHLAASLATRFAVRFAVGVGERVASDAAKDACLVVAALVCVATCTRARAQNAPRAIDVRRIEAAGLRVLEGTHVRMVTDLPSAPAVDELPAVFDAAMPLWAERFDVPAAKWRDAKWVGFLVQDRAKFAALGLMPAERLEFLSGYANGWEFWLVEQPSDYYRRHLWLHEGTHAFMQVMLGGAGAPWYMEGMAELLGTHTWRHGKLALSAMPAQREDMPMWGRVKLVRDAVRAGHAWPLERVLAVDNRRSMPTDEYAWTWALAALLDGHPRFQERFRALSADVRDPRFTEKFRKLFAEDWVDLLAEWDAMAGAVDYGYDVATMAMVHAENAPVESASRRSTILVNRGWQSAGWILRAGQSYRVSAGGRYTLVRNGEKWPCEPGGVTIDYYDGRPVGKLIGALRAVDGAPMEGASFLRPVAIGLGATVTATRDSELYLRVSDDPIWISKSSGKIDVRIETTTTP